MIFFFYIGITNHDEYSLVRENQEDETENAKPNFGTLTLRRKKDDKERDQKMEQLKKKIKTDDERNFQTIKMNNIQLSLIR